MRCSVSGGGTGGHIYPALAVARALRDARPDVELDYVGGVRGFERRLVAGHPMRGELPLPRARRPLAALGGPVAPHGPRPGPAGRLGPAGVVAARPTSSPLALFTTGGYLAAAARPGRTGPRHPDPGLGGQRPSRPRDPRHRPLRDAGGRQLPAHPRGLPGQQLRVRHPDPLASPASIARRRAAPSGVGPGRSTAARLRRLAGRDPPERGRDRRPPTAARRLACPAPGRRGRHGRCGRGAPGAAPRAARRGTPPSRS